MKYSNVAKKICAGGLMSVMLLGMMAGCSKKQEKPVYTKEEAASTQAMVIGDYDIYMDELMVYAIQEIVTYRVTPETVDKDEKTQKDQVLALARETKILYDVAINNSVELTEADLAARDQTIQNFKSSVPVEIFDKYGISDAIIEKVFTERTYVEKFENDIRNSMGQDISRDLSEGYKDYNFQSLYYMVFPTVEVDESNEPKKDENGNYIELDAAAKQEVKEQAEAALEEIRAGKAPEEVAEAYGVAPYCSETSGYVGAYGDNINDVMAELEPGECTDVTDSDQGYVIIYVRTTHDEEIKERYVYAVTSDYLDSEYNTLRNKWLASIPVDTTADMRGDAWEKFSMRDMSTMLVEAGLVE